MYAQLLIDLSSSCHHVNIMICYIVVGLGNVRPVVDRFVQVPVIMLIS